VKRLHYRTVRNNRIKLLGKVLCCEYLSNGELDGKRFTFIIYRGESWEREGLTCLWGTEALGKLVNMPGIDLESKEIVQLDKEDGILLAPDGFLNWYWWEEEKNYDKKGKGKKDENRDRDTSELKGTR